MYSVLAVALGACLVAFVWALSNWIKKKQIRLSWLSWIGILFSAGMGFFSLAWAVSCFVEAEFKAGAVGLVIFGGVTLLLFGLTRRRVLKDQRKQT